MGIELVYLIIGVLLGGLVGWWRAKSQATRGMLTEEEVEEDYILRQMYVDIKSQLASLKEEFTALQNDYILVSKALAAKEQYAENLVNKVKEQEIQAAQLQQRFQTEFENIANRLLDEKSRVFTSQNQTNIETILNPLKEKIKDFEDKIDRTYWKESQERISLKEEIKLLRDLNSQLSQEANLLASALRGDSKFQGDWGEFQLETLLQTAGLTKDIHYFAQASYRDEKNKLKRPDFIVNLPDDKQLIIDSKVSLKAYEMYHNSDKLNKKKEALAAHLLSFKNHIKDLGSKNYQQLYQIQSPDYVLMFVPIEPAFSLALSEDKQLFLDALDRNVVIVTASTLLATMRTVSYIWKQEKQKKNVLEIARQSGLLYDKFCLFIEDLKTIGKKMEEAKGAYDGAMNKLVDSKKYGDTLIGRAERIKSLGANSSKQLPDI